MLPRSIHVVPDGKISFFSWLNHPLYVPHFLYSFVNGHLNYFHVSATVHRYAVDAGVQISHAHSDFVFFGYIPRDRIAGYYDSSVFNFE